MARYALIDGYLDVVRLRARRRDVVDVLAELEDHLYSTVESLVDAGVEQTLAERQTLERFGSLEMMADSFASPRRGGLVVPTRFTKRSGTLAIVGGISWLVVVGLWWMAGVAPPWGEVEYQSLGAASAVPYGIGAIGVLAATTITFITVVALNRRHGSLGALGRVALASCALAVIASLAAWIFVGWGTLLMIGALATAVPMLQRGIAPRLPTIALGGAMVIGGVAAFIARLIDGSLSQEWVGLWGDKWIPNLIGVSVAVGILGLAMIGIGSWLRDEVPADIDIAERPLTT